MAESINLTDDDIGAPTIGALLERGRTALVGIDSARLEAELLLAHALGSRRSFLQAHAESEVGDELRARFRALLRRRAAGEPLAYLTGEREFWSLSLQVTPAVLIPRPETEHVVERALALLPPNPIAVADLGTGSGAIALALASERPLWHIVATERSSAALAVARANAARLGAQSLEFAAGDWFDALGARRFELIVSNPPYVAADDPALRALRHEPLEALSPGPSGLEALEHIVDGARAHLTPGGWLVLEHGLEQHPALARVLVAAGYARVRCYRDLAGRERVTEAQWPSSTR